MMRCGCRTSVPRRNREQRDEQQRRLHGNILDPFAAFALARVNPTHATRRYIGAEEFSVAGPEVVLSTMEWWNVLARAAEIGWTRAVGSAAIAAAAERRVRTLVEFAAAHSPFYRKMWRGVAAERAALRDLPAVTRHDLMAHFDDWLTDRSIRREDVMRFLRDRSLR